VRELLFDRNSIKVFNKNNFLSSLSSDINSAYLISRKENFRNIYKELKFKLKAKSFIIENKYVSRDYLDCFKGYIVHSFDNYSKYCKRLHFFKSNFSPDKIISELGNPDSKILKKLTNSYLGFIVVRPIPNAIFGLTLLNLNKSHPEDIIFGARHYETHILGFSKNIFSIAYQEQDRLTSACATASIWFVLNKLSLSPRHSLKSTIKITQSTGLIGNDGNRLFPNNGLSPSSVALALKKSKVDLFKMSIDDNHKNSDITRILYSYSFLALPILLIIEIKNLYPETKFHSVAIVGYKNNAHNSYQLAYKDISLVSDFIKIFYATDDQYGPLVNFEFENGRSLKCPWNYNIDKNTPIKNNSSQIIIKARHIIVPIFPKINVSYETIFNIITSIDKILSKCFKIIQKSNNSIEKYSLCWDIRIYRSNDYRSNVMLDTYLNYKTKSRIIAGFLPKYIWTAELLYGNERIFNFIFDATALRNSCFLIDILEYIHHHEIFGERLRFALHENYKNFELLFIDFDGSVWMNSIIKLLNVNYCWNKKISKDKCNICLEGHLA